LAGIKKQSVACGVKRLVRVNPGTLASDLTTMIYIYTYIHIYNVLIGVEKNGVKIKQANKRYA